MVLIAFYVQTNHYNIIITLPFYDLRTYEAMKNNQNDDGIYSNPAKLPSSFFTIGVFKISFLGFDHNCFSVSHPHHNLRAMTLNFIVMSGEWNFFLYILLRIPSRNWSPSRHHLQFHTHRIITTFQTQIIMEFCFFCLSTIKFSNIWCSLLNYKSFRLCGCCWSLLTQKITHTRFHLFIVFFYYVYYWGQV